MQNNEHRQNKVSLELKSKIVNIHQYTHTLF